MHFPDARPIEPPPPAGILGGRRAARADGRRRARACVLTRTRGHSIEHVYPIEVTENEANIGLRYIGVKLSAWAIRHGMARNGRAAGWKDVERY
jgi:hypothetical protein